MTYLTDSICSTGMKYIFLSHETFYFVFGIRNKNVMKHTEKSHTYHEIVSRHSSKFRKLSLCLLISLNM